MNCIGCEGENGISISSWFRASEKLSEALNQEEIENMNRLIISIEIESVI